MACQQSCDNNEHIKKTRHVNWVFNWCYGDQNCGWVPHAPDVDWDSRKLNEKFKWSNPWTQKDESSPDSPGGPVTAAGSAAAAADPMRVKISGTRFQEQVKKVKPPSPKTANPSQTQEKVIELIEQMLRKQEQLQTSMMDMIRIVKEEVNGLKQEFPSQEQLHTVITEMMQEELKVVNERMVKIESEVSEIKLMLTTSAQDDKKVKELAEKFNQQMKDMTLAKNEMKLNVASMQRLAGEQVAGPSHSRSSGSLPVPQGASIRSRRGLPSLGQPVHGGGSGGGSEEQDGP